MLFSNHAALSSIGCPGDSASCDHPVKDTTDKENLTERLSCLLPETQTLRYARAFLSNHAHFLFRSGLDGLSGLMQRLLTGSGFKGIGGLRVQRPSFAYRRRRLKLAGRLLCAGLFCTMK
ncbi:hypothetical protein DESC_460155 [Desulfosarcina cetonica]|nr:hypothetical protein DESC_460155 [Desulfosarcina cetonica]